jgi:hypothetical protein
MVIRRSHTARGGAARGATAWTPASATTRRSLTTSTPPSASTRRTRSGQARESGESSVAHLFDVADGAGSWTSYTSPIRLAPPACAVTRPAPPPNCPCLLGKVARADARTRTGDPFITSQKRAARACIRQHASAHENACVWRLWPDWSCQLREAGVGASRDAGVRGVCAVWWSIRTAGVGSRR